MGVTDSKGFKPNTCKGMSFSLNSAGNYFLPLLELLEGLPDSISCAYYIILSIAGGRNCWAGYDRERDLEYLARAKAIYDFYGKKDAIVYISNYTRLIYPEYI